MSLTLGSIRLVFADHLEPQPLDAPVQWTVLVVPGSEVACRWLDLPAADAQAVGAAGYILEDQIATPRERLHVALGRPNEDGQRLVVVVDKERMRAWLDAAAAVGIAPDAVVPDYLLVPEPEGSEALAVDVGGAYAVRGQGLGLSCDHALLPLILGERPYRTIIEPAEVRRILSAGAAAPPIDLQQGEFAKRRRGDGRGVKLAPILASLVVLSLVVLPVTRIVRSELAARDAARQVQALAGPVSAGQSADPVERLRQRTMKAESARDFSMAASAVFAAMERVDGMELQSLIYDESGEFRASVAHPNYTDIELLKSRLAQSKLTVEESSAVPEGDIIVSDLIIRPSR